MLVYPDIDPVAVSIPLSFHVPWSGQLVGPLSVHWYGLMYALAFLTAFALAQYRAKVRRVAGSRSPWTPEMISDLVFYGALGVMLGGRIGYVLFYGLSQFLADPLWIFRVWEGGMSFHGGFLGVIIATVLWAKRYHKTPFETLDFIAPCVPQGLLFGRMGNFVGGELWGRPVEDMNYPLAMVFRHVDQLPRHPSQLYEAAFEGLVLFVLLWFYSAKPRPRMAVSALFLLGYGLARFGVEFFRAPDQSLVWFGWLTRGQQLTLPMIIGGLLMLAYAYRQQVYDWGPRSLPSPAQSPPNAPATNPIANQ